MGNLGVKVGRTERENRRRVLQLGIARAEREREKQLVGALQFPPKFTIAVCTLLRPEYKFSLLSTFLFSDTIRLLLYSVRSLIIVS